jgi:hypothetical protein
MGENMRVLLVIDLLRMTRVELCDLDARVTNALPEYPPESEDCANARINQRNIRRWHGAIRRQARRSAGLRLANLGLSGPPAGKGGVGLNPNLEQAQ